MTAPQTPTDQTPEVDQDQTPPAGGDQGTEADKPQGRQARRDEQARQRAQELEAERDKLAGRLAAAQTREIEAIAANSLEQPGDLLALSGHEIADFLDPETGEVDEGAVAAALDQLLESRPGLGRGMVDPNKNKFHDWGHSRTKNNDLHAPGGAGAPSWSDAFGAAGRGGRHYT